MSQYCDIDHLKFLLEEVHDVQSVLALPRFQEHDKEGMMMLVDSVKEFADKELFPHFTEMDREGGQFKDGQITCPDHIKEVIVKAGDNGYICSEFDYEEGGIQMPHVVSIPTKFITASANNAALGYIGLTSGSAALIRSFGSKDLFEAFVPKMISGEWTGTMALTEPQAGSSLSDIQTSAKENEDGSYSIEGQKIFISGGDHQCAENIVHLTLARIEGAPAGTKGISLFVIPKFRKDEGGELVDNDVTTAGEFEKMGQRAYVTAHLVFGDKGNCKGWLVGEPNRGLKYMFQMMNAARLEVGLTAAGIASAAYQASLQYAKERPQGRKLDSEGIKDPSSGQVLIINHPDVRRMLMLQKAVVDGSISLLTLCGKYLDLSHEASSEKDRQYYHGLLELLTPIAKTYPSEMGNVSVSNGMQVLGGYGYTTDFPLEQLYRDIRITSIYEGTTGIQSMDLLGRKVVMNGGEAMRNLLAEIEESIDEAKTFEELAPFAQQLSDTLTKTQSVLGHLLQFAIKGQYEKFLADATIFMEYASTVVIAWQWLLMATASKKSLVTGDLKRKESFYISQIQTMKFYFVYELNKTLGLEATLLNNEELTILKKDEALSPLI